MMKQFLATCLLLAGMFSAVSASALDVAFAGIGAEANGYSREGAAAGATLSLGADLNQRFAAGVKATFSHNFDTIAAVEPLVFFRYRLPFLPGLFAQAEAGASIFLEDSGAYPAFSGGICAGWRLAIGSNFYIEPVIRGGFPFAWGAGLTAGYKLQMRSEKREKKIE